LKNIFLISAVIILFSGSCKIIAYKKYAQKLNISFGSGGGFTGAYDEFLLNGKGQLSSIKPFSNDTSLLKTIDKKDFKNVFKTLESKLLQKIELNQVGNMNTFIKLYKNNQLIKSFQWADGATPSTELKELYNTLINFTTKNPNE